MTSRYESKSLDQLKRSRSAISGVITKNKVQIDAILTQEIADIDTAKISFLEGLQEKLEERLADSAHLNAAILEKTPDEDAAVEQEFVNAEEFEERIRTLIKTIDNFLQQLEKPDPALVTAVAATTSSTGTASGTGHLKMPKFDLPKFDGQYTKWVPFYEQFIASVDSNSSIPDIQKFNYLKSALSGEALQLVAHIPLSTSNYKVALKSLRKRYNIKRLIINSHIDKILQLKPLVNESAVELRKLMVAFEENLMALDALNVKGGDPYLIRFLWQKLDEESRKQWELHCPGTDLETLDEFKDFINKRVRALESYIDPSTQNKSSQKTSFSREIHRQKTHFPAPQSYKATIETCPCCNEAHKLFMCKKFESLNVKDRKNVAYNSKLCFNCLSSGHVTKDCKSKSSCKKCQARHNTLLHVEPHSKNGETSSSVVLGHQGTFFSAGILPTAIVTIEDQASNIHTCRALLDTGSQINLISEEAAQRMGLKREKRSLTVNVVGNISKTHNSGLVQLHLKSKNYGKSISIQAFVLPKLTQNVPSKTFLTDGLLHMKTVELADPTFNNTGSIDLILGSEIIEDIYLDGKFEESNGLKFRNTIFGWVASGKHPQGHSPSFTTSLCINETFDLKKFWELEELPPAEKFTQEEIDCEKHFTDTTKVVNNRFTVQMPFKENSQKLGDTYVQAKRRFLILERRLHANDKLKQDYTDFVNEFITLQHLEKVPEEEYEIDSKKVNFLPHHCVHKEDSTTTKIRVVFDGSAKSTSGVSLNDTLMVGPTIQQDLFSILIRFRLHQVALSADIAKMYRQIALSKEAQNFHRILWREDPSKPIEQFRMTRVTYGIASSAFHSTRSLVEVGNLCKNEEIGHSIKFDFYVDDYLSGAETLEDAKQKVHEICTQLKQYGMELRKWASSHSDIIVELPQHLRESSDEEKFMDQNYKIKTLGISWKPNLDSFIFHSNFSDTSQITKPKLLSETAKLFDQLVG